MTTQETIKKCRLLWGAYCKKPNKTNLKKVEVFCEKMKDSKSKTVREERKRCMAIVRKEYKRLSRNKNPSEEQHFNFFIQLLKGAKAARQKYNRTLDTDQLLLAYRLYSAAEYQLAGLSGVQAKQFASEAREGISLTSRELRRLIQKPRESRIP